MTSSAPCLYGTHLGEHPRCYQTVVQGTGYCPRHQRERWAGHTWEGPKPADWNRLKEIVFKRDKGICYICNQPGATEVDHVIALALGGSNNLYNLKPVHHQCHLKKTQTDSLKAYELNNKIKINKRIK